MMVEEHRDDIIQDDITFGKLYNSKIRTVLVHLEGYVFPKWHFGRIITLGDAAHKVGHLYDNPYYPFTWVLTC